MIVEKQMNLLETECDIIAHQTNCVGVMGAGVAKQIKDNLLTEEAYNKYKSICAEEGASLLGKVQFLFTKNGNKLIANLFGEDIPTGTGLDTDYVALKRSLMELKAVAKKNNLSIALPGYIGCGLAGGDWEIVHEMINTIFSDSEVEVEICYLPETFAKKEENNIMKPDEIRECADLETLEDEMEERMIRLMVSIPYNLYVETKEHLTMNGYHFIWDDIDVLEVDEDEVVYVKTILHDRGIGFTEA